MTTATRTPSAAARPAEAEWKTLAGFRGPAVSIYLSGHQGGALTPPAPARLRAMLKNLREEQPPHRHADLIDPIEALLDLRELERGHRRPLAIFRCAEHFYTFWLNGDVTDRAYAGHRFLLLPLLADASTPADCLVLALSRKPLELRHLSPDGAEPMPLPAGVPASFEEFLSLDQPDHQLANTSPSGPGARNIRFSTGTEHEKQRNHWHDFCRAVDKALTPFVRSAGVPLVVASTANEFAAYKAVADPEMLAPVAAEPLRPGAAREAAWQSSVRQALGAWLPPAYRHARTEAAKLAGGPGTAIALEPILKAALDGRVRQLFVASSALGPAHGHFEELNLAAVETLAHSGEVWITPPNEFGAGPLLAILRKG